MLRNCKYCGGRLDHFEGESFCPDCTYYQAVEAHDHATDEALAVLAQDHPEPAMPDNDLPF